MSIRLMSTVWGIQWPSQSALLVALKMADYANDDGSSVYPARDTLAGHAHCSLATVARVIAGFKENGLLAVVRQGGKGPHDSTEYRMNVAMLERLHAGAVVFVSPEAVKNGASCYAIMAPEAVNDGDNKGVTVSPLLSTSVSPGELSVSPGEKSVSIDETQTTILNPPLKNTTSANSDLKVAGAKPAIVLTPADLSWTAWLEALCLRGKEGLAADALQAGAMTVTQRWPKGPDDPLPRVDRRKFHANAVSARIQGGT
jgi:hypothetical protein